MSNELLNYCPNMIRDFATQTVRLVFGQWEHRVETVVEIDGNCGGLSIMESAVYDVWSRMEDKEDYDLWMVGPDGDQMLCQIESESDLQEMLISAEIVAIRPEVVG